MTVARITWEWSFGVQAGVVDRLEVMHMAMSAMREEGDKQL